MRNLFDQYEQPENRLTHALFTALERDLGLLASFLVEICGVADVNPNTLRLSVQRFPRGRDYSFDEIESRTVPDAWIFDEDIAFVFEAKVTAQLTLGQLSAHRRVVEGHGFGRSRLFAITATAFTDQADGWKPLRWSEIYRWLRNNQGEAVFSWARAAADYFEILEAKLLSNGTLENGQLTTFAGFFKDETEFGYLQAKVRLHQAMHELRTRPALQQKIGADPDAAGRGAITGKGADAVWNFLSLKGRGDAAHTQFPHLTLDVGRRDVRASVTVPNNLQSGARRALTQIGLEGFETLCRSVLDNAGDVLRREPHARPFMRAVQRRYPSRRGDPINDATLEFDLRTAFSGISGGPKCQREWIEALFRAVSNKNSNLQFQLGVSFEYAKCPQMSEAGALELIENSWIACKPLIDRAMAGALQASG